MERRGFFGALAALLAAPFASRLASEPLPTVQVTHAQRTDVFSNDAWTLTTSRPDDRTEAEVTVHYYVTGNDTTQRALSEIIKSANMRGYSGI